MITDIHAAERVVRVALREYDDAQAELTFVKYRENWVFRVDQRSGSFAVRVHRFGYRSDAELQEELDLLAALRQRSVPVPLVRQTLDGYDFCHVRDDDGQIYQVDMLAWIDGGEPLGDIGAAFAGAAVVDPEQLRQVGALMAQLHNASMSVDRGALSVRPAWDRDGLVGDEPIWGDPHRAFVDAEEARVVVEATKVLTDNLMRYGTAPDRFGPIHADFTPENILSHDGGLSVIDFDDSGPGYYIFDLATAAFFYLPHPEFQTVVEALLEGYESERPLASADRSMWTSMLFARGLTYLGWATDRRGDETSTFLLVEVRPIVVELAQSLIAAPVL